MTPIELPERRVGRCAARTLLTLLWIALFALPIRAEEPDAAQTRAIMGEVFAALERLLPLSLDEKRFADPARRAEIQTALATLSRNAGRLSAHGAGRDESFSFLSRSLAREAKEIERRFGAGRYREARFEIHELTESCVACHSRLPDPQDSELSSRFMDEAEIAALPLPERARLAMATRQFEQALAAQEAMLASPEFDAASLDLDGYLDDYLEVCVRVKNDFQRPARALEAFAKRPDLRAGLRSHLARWLADLRELARRGPIEGFEAGRGLAEEAEAATAKGDARAQLVRYQAASGALHRFVAAAPSSDRRTAEAYRWLGVIESRIGRSFWLSQTEPYLEAAIRLAPGDPVAKQSYALLEEFVGAGYSGSSGEHVPPDVRIWLDELKKLASQAPGTTQR
jgi:tetratricopeptide (TPR) repeat protein